MKNEFISGTIRSLIHRLLTKDKMKRINLQEIFRRFFQKISLNLDDKANLIILQEKYQLKNNESIQSPPKHSLIRVKYGGNTLPPINSGTSFIQNCSSEVKDVIEKYMNKEH
mmetsp:Transcript_14692/g.12929  ORF Transcript_14692/g.12929 Transcript_14692/m.12929 type:complete len:112 (+) Transcript_14692:1141-1476(+)